MTNYERSVKTIKLKLPIGLLQERLKEQGEKCKIFWKDMREVRLSYESHKTTSFPLLAWYNTHIRSRQC